MLGTQSHPSSPCSAGERPRGRYLWLCRRWSSRCSSSGSTHKGCRTGTCAAHRSHRRSGPRRSLQDRMVSAGGGTRGGQQGLCLLPSRAPGVKANEGMFLLGAPHLSTGTLGAAAAPLSAPAGMGATDQVVPGSQLHAGAPAVAQPVIWKCSQYGQQPWPPPGPLLTLPGPPSPSTSPGATLALSPHWHRVGGSSSPSAARAAASRASASAAKSSFILDSRERSPPVTAADRAAASTVCSACPGGREQTGQGQNREERGRDSLP